MIRVTAVLPPGLEGSDDQDGFIATAARLTRTIPGAALDILELVQGSGGTPRAPEGGASWWQCQCGPGEVEPATLAALLAEVLTAPGLAEGGRRIVLLAAGQEGEEAAALLAARLQGRTLGRCARIAVEGAAVVGHRPAWGGGVALVLQTEAALVCATLRPGAADAALVPLAEADVRSVALAYPLPAAPQREAVTSDDTRPRLEGARAVVSGGRGMEGPEGFAMLARVADALAAGLGGSLPTVDAGWVPVARQVGISGKFVSPRVYFAVGISGTPQHLAGINPASSVVALNKDPDAPIFKRADVGAVADWREVLPLLAEKLEAARRG